MTVFECVVIGTASFSTGSQINRNNFTCHRVNRFSQGRKVKSEVVGVYAMLFNPVRRRPLHSDIGGRCHHVPSDC